LQIARQSRIAGQAYVRTNSIKYGGLQMSSDLFQLGETQAYWNVSRTRILKYSVEVYHKGLKEHKVLSAPDIDILQNKVKMQAQKWKEEWQRKDDKRRVNEEKEASIEKAANDTQEANKALCEVDDILRYTLNVNDAIDWKSLKKNEKYTEDEPQKPKEPSFFSYPKEPSRVDIQFSFIDKIFKSLKAKKIEENETNYNHNIEKWQEEKRNIDIKNEQIKESYLTEQKKWECAVEEWNKRKNDFYMKQDEFNLKIDDMENKYYEKNTDSIIEYCDMVLNNSYYPDSFNMNYELEYHEDSKILIIEYQLPAKDDFPTLKEVKYIASRKELKESYISEAQSEKMIDDAYYKITLRTIHEIFEADTAKAVDAISFNGWVKAINKANGQEENNCILSIQVNKEEFLTIDLSKVDPKVCFKNLKGVASSKLCSLTPIQPILQISRVDKRFVESYEVAKNLDESKNIAAMDWEDFEHLIRELFEKEFSVNGGEVKITQASRDGGVDAVAFDPDPIRGGKIVIQAKRYTNTVGVSAVRDLYGTTMNEGATKGILVSTADYGPDAYEFAKGKPLTLLNGSDLLHLLLKHGYHAKIDLKEAKKILSDGSF